MPEVATSPARAPFRALIAGGGVAGLEAAFALQAIAPDSVEVSVLAPDTEFSYRPMSVREPFSYAPARRYPLAPIVSDAGAALVPGALSWVDPDQRVAHTAAGEAVDYDALLLAVGARGQVGIEHASTVDDRRIDEILRGLIQDIEDGYVHSVAFVMPSEKCWPLPLYELALMTAERAFAMCVDVHVTIVTPERSPLAVFGEEASAAVSALLDERGIAVETNAVARSTSKGRIDIPHGNRSVVVDRIVALPLLAGPGIRGLHPTDDGFIPIDKNCRVVGTDRVFAAGDATDYPVKHGGLSSQQADTAARQIARLAGEQVEGEPFHPTIHGMLLTGRAPLYISATVVGRFGFRSEVARTPLWSPPTKIAAHYLAPYLDRLDRSRSHADAMG